MTTPAFHETRMGRQFFERTLPELVRQVERLADSAEHLAARAVRNPVQGVPVKHLNPGSRVVIRFNPHHSAASEVVGEVTDFQPGVGFMGCDLAYVRYQHPGDGEIHVMPFSTANLELGDRAGLLARAARHDEQAAKFRAMADEVSR